MEGDVMKRKKFVMKSKVAIQNALTDTANTGMRMTESNEKLYCGMLAN
jgi:hypothetical protein